MGDRIFLNKGGVDSHCDSYCNRNCCSFTVVAGCYFFHEILISDHLTNNKDWMFNKLSEGTVL